MPHKIDFQARAATLTTQLADARAKAKQAAAASAAKVAKVRDAAKKQADELKAKVASQAAIIKDLKAQVRTASKK